MTSRESENGMLISHTGPVNPKTTAGQPKQKKQKPAASGENTEKRNATLRERIEVLDWYHANGKNQSKTARHFKEIYPDIDIKQPLVSSWVKDEAKWRRDWAASAGMPGAQDARRIRQTEHPEVTEMMDLWVLQAREQGIILSGAVLRTKWKSFADRAGIPSDQQLSLSEGWLARFKDRHDLRSIKRHGEAGSVDPKTVAAERERIQKIIKEGGFQPRDIYNMDETGLFYQYVHPACPLSLSINCDHIGCLRTVGSRTASCPA